MSNLVFYIEYGPLLSRVHKSAFLVYTYYDKFQNDSGIVQLTYSELNDHLGLASSTIQKANAILKKLQLIEEVEAGQAKKYRLLPVKKLSEEVRQEILTKTKSEDYNLHTGLRKRYLEEDIPAEYQQLLNKKVLRDARKEIGSLKVKDLCHYFNIDYYTFKLLCERGGEDSFKIRFKNLCQQVEQEFLPKEKKKVVMFGAKERDLATYLYDKLNDLGAKPIGKTWFMKNCNIAKGILSNITLEEAKCALEWGFEDNWWQTKITDLNCMPTLYSRYRLQSKKCVKVARSTPIPEVVRQQIQTEIKTGIQVNTYEDAAFLKQSILDGQDNEDISRVVTILENSGIIPSGNDNLSFG